MTLAEEAFQYWTLARGYRTAVSEVGRDFIAQIQIPTLALQVENHRIIMHLSNIMSQEGISNEDSQSLDPSL